MKHSCAKPSVHCTSCCKPKSRQQHSEAVVASAAIAQRCANLIPRLLQEGGGERAWYILIAHASLITQNLGDHIFIPSAHSCIVIGKLSYTTQSFFGRQDFPMASMFKLSLLIVRSVLSSVGGTRDKKQATRGYSRYL